MLSGQVAVGDGVTVVGARLVAQRAVAECYRLFADDDGVIERQTAQPSLRASPHGLFYDTRLEFGDVDPTPRGIPIVGIGL